MRNMEKAVEQGRKIVRQRERLDLRASEAKRMEAKYRGGEADIYDVIQDAFLAGLAIGYRNGGK